MRVIVYVDVLICVNFIINYALLLLCARISGRAPSRARLALSALTGAASSLIIFAGAMGALPSAGFKLLVSLTMVLLANKFMGIRQALKEWLIFFTVSFLFGGVMLGVSVGLKPASLLYYNGIVYFDISLLSLVIFTAAAYVLTELFNRVYRSQSVRAGDYGVTVEMMGASQSFIGRVDTGNALRDMFSDTPVAVCCYLDMQKHMPPEVSRAFASGEGIGALSQAIENSGLGRSFRLIPYNDVSGHGLLPALRADLITIRGPDGEFRIEDAFLAMTGQKVGDGSYNLLLSPRMTAVKNIKAGALR